MTIKMPDKTPWSAVFVAIAYRVWRGLLHVLRIKPWDED